MLGIRHSKTKSEGVVKLTSTWTDGRGPVVTIQAVSARDSHNNRHSHGEKTGGN